MVLPKVPGASSLGTVGGTLPFQSKVKALFGVSC